MDSPRTRMYTHPFFEATPPGAAPGPPVKNRVPVFATSGGVITFGLTRRFRMLDMRWKALDRAMNLS